MLDRSKVKHNTKIKKNNTYQKKVMCYGDNKLSYTMNLKWMQNAQNIHLILKEYFFAWTQKKINNKFTTFCLKIAGLYFSGKLAIFRHNKSKIHFMKSIKVIVLRSQKSNFFNLFTWIYILIEKIFWKLKSIHLLSDSYW